MRKDFEYDTFNMPSPWKAPVIEEDLPFFLVGDEILPLKSWSQRPFPGPLDDESKKIINYRSSRARRTIENTVGILSAKWQIFRQPIKADIETV